MDAFVRRVAIEQLRRYSDLERPFHAPNYDALESLVDQGSVRVIHIDAVARSMSTILGRALAEAEGPSIYVNEPLNKFNHSLDIAAGNLLDAYRSVENNDEPVTIVTKSIARNLSTESFIQLMRLCDGVVFSIRNPLTQVCSLLARITNDRFVHRGADVLTHDEVAASAQWIVREEEWEAWHFESTGWPAIDRHFQASGHLKHVAVVDGEDLLADPQAVLMEVCGNLGLTYRPSMIDGWRRPVLNAASLDAGYGHQYDAQGVPTNAWVRHAAASRGFEPPSKQPGGFDISCLPPSLQQHLLEVAKPIYERLRVAGALGTVGKSPNGLAVAPKVLH